METTVITTIICITIVKLVKMHYEYIREKLGH